VYVFLYRGRGMEGFSVGVAVLTFGFTLAAFEFGRNCFFARRVKRRFGMEYGVGSSNPHSGWWFYRCYDEESHGFKLGFRDSGAIRWLGVTANALVDIGVSIEQVERMSKGDIYQLCPLGIT